MQRHNRAGHNRTGAALVEFAVTFPLFMIMVVGLIDVGRALMVQHTLVETARAACRLYAVKDGPTIEDMNAVIEKAMADAGIENYGVELNPDPSVEVEDLTPVTVSISVAFDEVSWRPSWFLPGNTLSASCTIPADVGTSSRE
jgi:Flp pilus assembly protein TadG